jgi:hypothetical protein
VFCFVFRDVEVKPHLVLASTPVEGGWSACR